MAPKTYTLTFDSQGGTEVTSQTVVEGQTRSRPAQNPTKTNWTFVNWYTSTGYDTVFDFNTIATANTTVYAKWQSNGKKLTLDFQYDQDLDCEKDTTDYYINW